MLIAGICFASEAPQQVAVFKLNSNIADVKDYVIMETALPIRYMENIEEVEIKPIEGIKSGLIAYATCATPGHIVRIKLKRETVWKVVRQATERKEKRSARPWAYLRLVAGGKRLQRACLTVRSLRPLL